MLEPRLRGTMALLFYVCVCGGVPVLHEESRPSGVGDTYTLLDYSSQCALQHTAVSVLQ